MTNRRTAFLFGALVLVRILAVPVTLHQGASSGHHAVLPGDVQRFHRIAVSHGTPYRTFEVEYPPLTLFAIDALDGGSVRASTVRLMWSQLVCDLAIAAVVAWGWGRRASLAYLVLGAPFVAYPFIYLRLDLLSVLLAVLGLALMRKLMPLTGGVVLAASCFAKPWPLLVLPMLLVRRWWLALATTLVTGALGLATWIAWGGFRGVREVVTFRGAKGWEIESIVGALVRGLTHDRVHVESGAWRVGAAPAWMRYGLDVVVLALVGLVWLAAWRSGDRSARLLDGVAPLTAITAFMVVSPLLSPQFACWILPFAAVAAAGRERLLGALAFAVIALSTLDLFLVKETTQGYDYALAFLFLRNALLVALLVVGFVRVFSAGRGMAEPARREPLQVQAA